MARIGMDARMCAYRTGGIASYTRQLAAALVPVLAERGHRLVLGHARRGARVLSASNDLSQPSLWTPPHHRFESFALPVELLRWRCTLIHTPDFIPPRFGARRTVITVHDLDFVRHPERLTDEARRYYGQIERAVHDADAIIAVSQATRDDLISLLDAPAERIRVIYEAADPLFRPRDHKTRSGARQPYFLMVGTIEPRKNHATILDAYQAYRATAPEPHRLVVVGAEGWKSAPIAARLRTDPNVEWLPGATAEQLAPLYHDAAALLMPSWYEGFGLPVIEAMASGTPVAVSATPALVEIAGGAALVAPPDDTRAWRAIMERLTTEPAQWEELRVRGLVRAEDFSWRRAARETADVYDAVLTAPAEARKERAWR